MKPLVQVADIREIFALVPFQLGYEPRESVVAIALKGSRQRIGVMARTDGSDLLRPDGPHIVSSIAEFLHRDAADRVMLIIYHDASPGVRSWLPGAIEMLREHLTGFEAVNAWLVSRGSYRSATLFPADSRELVWSPESAVGDLAATQVSATMVVRGNVIHKDRSQLAALPHISKEMSQRMWRAGDRYLRDYVRAQPTPRTQRWLHRSLELWQVALDAACARHIADLSGPPDLAPLIWARLGASLGNRETRDLVIGMIIARALRDSPGTGGDEGSLERLGHLMSLMFGTVPSTGPEEGVLRSLCETVAFATAATRRKHRSDGYSVLAMMAWWRGSGAAGREYCERALRLDGDHRMSVLVMQMLDDGVPPGWADCRLDDAAFVPPRRE